MPAPATEWAFEPDDFAALWFSEANDRLPGLLRYTSRFTYLDDLEAHRAAVRARVPSDDRELIDLALHTIASADLRIEILGGSTNFPGNTGPTQRAHRIIASRNTFHGAILHQITQDDIEGRFRLYLCRPETLSARTVSALPPAKPGTHQPITVHPADLRDNESSYTATGPADRYRRLLSTEGTGGGTARLLPGPWHTRTTPMFQLQWYDLPDGRYLETTGENITIRPASAADITTRFDQWIARAQDLLREDEPSRW